MNPQDLQAYLAKLSTQARQPAAIRTGQPFPKPQVQVVVPNSVVFSKVSLLLLICSNKAAQAEEKKPLALEEPKL